MARPPLIPMSEGVKILYKGAIDNVIFLKRQQWIITNYSLVAYAAVVALAKNATAVEKTILVLLAVAASFYAVSCMLHTQHTLGKLRASIDHIYRTHFTEQERADYRFWPVPPGFWYTPLFIVGLIATNLIAAAAAIYLILRVPYGIG
jgi:hypothetical protein